MIWEVNLELGRPSADEALRRLEHELAAKRHLRAKAMKIIHGYGSSGTGGKIRLEARKYLARLSAKGEIGGFIPGEEFSIFQEDTRRAFLRCDELRRDRDLERHNNGVTFILLKH